MRSIRFTAALAALSMILAVGCSQQRANNPKMKDNVETALKNSGFDKVNIDEDRDKGVVTLKGDVQTEADKQRAEEVARQAAPNSIIANQLLVTEGDKGQAKDVASATDDAIEARFKEFVTVNKLENQHIRADAEKGVLTLTGDVDSAAMRTKVEKDAAKIAGVTEVVNKLEVKQNRNNKKATSTE